MSATLRDQVTILICSTGVFFSVQKQSQVNARHWQSKTTTGACNQIKPNTEFVIRSENSHDNVLIDHLFLEEALCQGKLSFRRCVCTQVHQNAQLFPFLQRNSGPRMPEEGVPTSSASEDLSLIPGFGFLPQTMVSRAESIFQARYFNSNRPN